MICQRPHGNACSEQTHVCSAALAGFAAVIRVSAFCVVRNNRQSKKIYVAVAAAPVSIGRLTAAQFEQLCDVHPCPCYCVLLLPKKPYHRHTTKMTLKVAK
jgi:hypothetical protein